MSVIIAYVSRIPEWFFIGPSIVRVVHRRTGDTTSIDVTRDHGRTYVKISRRE